MPAASLDAARLALAVEATDLGIWEWNVDTGEVHWSESQRAIWGIGPEQKITYELWRDSIHPEDRDDVLARVNNTLDRGSGGEQKLQHRIVRPNGEVRWISSHGRMIYDDATGLPQRLIGTVSDITERQAADAALQRALESKDILLREVNHRIKNNLQLVSSLLALQGGRSDHPEIRRLIQEAQSRIKAVATVHERLYRSADLRSVELDAFIEVLCRDIESTFADEERAIAIEVATEPVKIANDRAVHVGLILNELLTNALKYAYPEGRGSVNVTLRLDEAGRCTLTVADAGVGMPDDFQSRMKSSLGHRIIGGLAQELNAEIEISERRPGTAISVRFDPDRYDATG